MGPLLRFLVVCQKTQTQIPYRKHERTFIMKQLIQTIWRGPWTCLACLHWAKCLIEAGWFGCHGTGRHVWHQQKLSSGWHEASVSTTYRSESFCLPIFVNMCFWTSGNGIWPGHCSEKLNLQNDFGMGVGIGVFGGIIWFCFINAKFAWQWWHFIDFAPNLLWSEGIDRLLGNQAIYADVCYIVCVWRCKCLEYWMQAI